jgi:hypothetical protein
LRIKIQAAEPDPQLAVLLPGAQFRDAFRTTTGAFPLDARMAATKMFAYAPGWVTALMKIRNAVVTPFGLKTPSPAEKSGPNRIGIFPVISETPERLVAGFDDKHLDFRVVVDVAALPEGSSVTAATLVRTHNLLGRTYLATILPFHRMVVRAMLGQV